jgi:hypothetical protein
MKLRQLVISHTFAELPCIAGNGLFELNSMHNCIIILVNSYTMHVYPFSWVVLCPVFMPRTKITPVPARHACSRVNRTWQQSRVWAHSIKKRSREQKKTANVWQHHTIHVPELTWVYVCVRDRCWSPAELQFHQPAAARGWVAFHSVSSIPASHQWQ